MNSNTVTPRPPLPRWVWIVGATIAAAAIVVGLVLWSQRPSAPTAATSPTASASPASTTAPAGADVVTGCLADGQSLDMLLTTQKKAPHTRAGAVEFTTALVRFGTRWPWPSADEFQGMVQNAWAGDKGYNQSDYDALVAGQNASGGIVPEGTNFHVTSGVGRWHVVNYTGDTAQVVVGVSYVIGDAVSPLYKGVMGYNLVWTDHGWKATSGLTGYTPQQLFNDGIGTPYTGGC